MFMKKVVMAISVALKIEPDNLEMGADYLEVWRDRGLDLLIGRFFDDNRLVRNEAVKSVHELVEFDPKTHMKKQDVGKVDILNVHKYKQTIDSTLKRIFDVNNFVKANSIKLLTSLIQNNPYE